MQLKLVSKLSKFIATSGLLVGVLSNSEINANQIPSRLSITLYEIGFRNSTNGNLNPVFKDLSGDTMIDLIEYKGKPTNLIKGLQSPSDGIFDQLYFITSNNPLVSGSNGSGCYIKQGTYDYNDGVVVGALTTNSALAATVSNPASMTETGFGGSNDNYGPVTPAVTASVNGSATTGMKLVLVNDNNASSKPYTKFLHYANLSSSVNIQEKKEGTLILTYNTDEAMGFRASGGGAGCDNYFWDTIGINLSIE